MKPFYRYWVILQQNVLKKIVNTRKINPMVFGQLSWLFKIRTKQNKTFE